MIKVLRDPTRGGLATSLHEIASASKCGIRLEELCIPVAPPVQSACEFFGLDPMLVANEGKLVAVVPSEWAARLLDAMQSHPLARRTAIIGRVVEDPYCHVVARTSL